MSGLYSWVGNITFYLIFITVVMNLLPNKKYEKYLKLFTGMVFILLVLKPLTGSLRLEDKIAYYFESITFRNESEDLQKELTGMEEQRMSQMIAQYEEAVAGDVEAMAKDMEFYPVTTAVTIEADKSSPEFGTVTHIDMTVVKEPQEDGGETTGGNPVKPVQSVEPVKPVEPVQIGEKSKEDVAVPVPDEKLNRLRRKVEDYYGLQTMDVEIKLEKG